MKDAIIGRSIAGKFLVESFLGGGAMGKVYRARQVDLDKTVAIKVLHEELLAEPSFPVRFKREAKAASRIDHPNSVRVLDYGQEPDGLLYIAMEFLDGRSLFQIIQAEAPLAPSRIVELLRQALAALAAAHDMQIVHRDLKPENIVVLAKKDDEGEATERVKVCDFGIAKFTASRAATTSNEKLTQEGALIGTPEYMSPEQARGEVLDARSDLYSMGVILYEALTGKLPFEAETPLAIVLKHLEATPQRPSERYAKSDPRLEAVCLRAMEKSPEKRFQSAREMRAALTGESVRVPTPAMPVHVTKKRVDEPRSRPVESARAMLSEPSRSARSLAPIAVGILALALGALGVLAWKGRHGKADEVVAPATAAAAMAADAPPISTSATPSARATLPAAIAAAAMATAADPTPPASVPVRSAASGKPSSSTSTRLAQSTPTSTSTSTRTPTSNPPSAASATARPFASTARVVAGQVHANNVSSSDVTSALPANAFDRCYREALRARGAAITGSGTLHFDFERDSVHVSFVGPPDLAPIGQCIANASKSIDVTATTPGSASADVDLSFTCGAGCLPSPTE